MLIPASRRQRKLAWQRLHAEWVILTTSVMLIICMRGGVPASNRHVGVSSVDAARFTSYRNQAGPMQYPSTDPCAKVSLLLKNGDAVFPSQFRDCLNVFPLNVSAAYETIDSIKKTMAVYVFELINDASPTPFLTNNVNIAAQLRKIASRLPPLSNEQKSPAPSPSAPDEESQNINYYTSEYEFQDALYSLYHSTNDAHTVYSTSCFQGFGFLKTAFPLISVIDDGQQLIKIAAQPRAIAGSLFSNQTENLLNITLSDYGSAEVVSIEGQPALEYVLNYVRYFEGNARDISCRLNAAMARPVVSAINTTTDGSDAGSSVLQFLPGGFSSRQDLSMNDSIRFVVKRLNSTSSETLDVPWLVKYLGIPFSDAGSYFQNQCVAFSSSLSKSIASKGTQTNPLPPSWATLHDIDLGDLKNFQKKSASEATRDQNSPQGDGVHIVYDNFVKAFLLGVSGVGVVLVPSENLYNPNQARPSPLIQQITQALNTVHLSGATKLILDFQNNGGGDIIDGYTIPLILFPNQPLHQFPTQFRAAPLIVDMVNTASVNENQNSLFWWGNWADAYGEPFQNSSGFVFPLLKELRGRVEQFLSSPFKDQVLNNLGPMTPGNTIPGHGSVHKDAKKGEGAETEFGKDGSESSTQHNTPGTQQQDAQTIKLGGPSPPFPSSNILFLTNGLCQSTCALVGAYMQGVSGVKTVTVGGIMNRSMEVENTGGGQVQLYDSFLAEIANLNLQSSPSAPRSFPLLKTSFSFTLRQALTLVNESLPLEFSFVPSDYRVLYTEKNVFDLSQLYMDVAQIFVPKSN